MNTDNLKYMAGAALSWLMPGRTRVIRKAFTLPYFDSQIRGGALERLIRLYIARSSRKDPMRLEKLHKNFWRRQGTDGWHGATKDRLKDTYYASFSDLVQRCALEISTRRIERVVEFGTGDGDWLRFLSQHWQGPSTFIGIDIAEQRIAINVSRHPNLVFECADLTHWVEEHAVGQTIFVTQGGVLEYLSECSLRRFFEAISQRCPSSLLFLIEPLATGHNLDSHRESRLYGAEYSYSHNYPYQLSRAGISLLHQEERAMSDQRWLVVLAAVSGSDP